MRTLWCLWFASSMAMPYLLGFAEPAGVVAYAGSYGFAALGMILGVWFATYPYPAFKSRRGDAPNVWLGLLLLGLLVCTALGIFELGRLALLRSAPLPPWVTHWNTLAAPVEKPLVFCNALLCGIVGVCIAPMDPEAPAVTWRRRSLLTAAFLAGLTRGTAWTLLLPSPAHPLPPTGWRLNPEDYWVDTLPVGAGIALVLACGLAWAWLATRRRGPLAKPALAPTIGALCLGELSWRFATRIVPLWLEVSALQAACALGIHLACLGAAIVLCQLTAPSTAQPPNDAPGAPVGSKDNILSPRITNILVAHGLTPQEIAVLQAAVLGLTSSQAASELGIRASTVRTYRARICKKLDTPTVDQLVTDIRRKQGLFAPIDSPEAEAAKKADLPNRLGALGGSALLLLLCMPYREVAIHWDCTWLIPYGVALGLVIPAAWRALFPMSQKRTGLISAFVLAAAVAGTLGCYYLLAQQAPYETSPAGLRLGMVLNLSLATAGAIRCMQAYREHLSTIVKQTPNMGVILGSLSLVVVASLGTPWWIACTVLSGLLACLGVAFQGGHHSPMASCSAAPSLLTLACTATLAFIWEESLRGNVYASLQHCGTLFLILIAIATVYRLARSLPLQALLGALVLPTVILIGLQGISYGLIACIGVANLVGASPDESPCSKAPSSRWHTPCIAAGFGLGIAVYVANVWGSLAHRYGNPVMGGDAMFATALTVFFSVLGVLQVIALLDRPAKPPLDKDEPTNREQLASLLRSRGLTPLQVNVALCAARGASVKELANEFTYSPSAINQVLRDIGSALGARDRAHLLNLLGQPTDTAAR